MLLATVALGASAAGGAPSGGPSLEKLVGQTIVTGVAGTSPSPALLARIRAGQVGGVILFGVNTPAVAVAARLIKQLQQAAAAGGNPTLLVLTDQEGGGVNRLPGPPDLSEASLGRLASSAKARAEGVAAGNLLREAGVGIDLAPVLDTPDSLSNFLGTRAYGRDAKLNARLGAGFVGGLQSRYIAATAKHFPGLGTATANTDMAHVLITTSKRALDARLLPFTTAIRQGVKLVMLSNAGYSAYDPSGLPALLSKPIVAGLLRGKLGFRGVAITDALEAPGPSSRPDAPARALGVGVDVLLYTAESTSAAGYQTVLAAVRSGALPLSAVKRADARIAALKAWLAHA